MSYTSYQDTMDSGATRVVLTAPNGMVQILPEKGFNLFSWIEGGRELTMPTQDVGVCNDAAHGFPILFPTPNRIRDCTYTFGGKQHTLVKNGEKRFIHGLMIDEPFTYEHWADAQGAYSKGVATIQKGDNKYDGYPFPCRFTVLISYRATGLTYDFTVENQGDGEMPFGLAIHPYFTKTGDMDSVFLSCPATHRYPMDEDLLPTGELIPVAGDPQYDIAQLRPLSSMNVDTVFSGMDASKSSHIEFRQWGYGLRFHADDDFGKVVVYTPPDRPGFCIEPQTCSTDFINIYARGLKDESGMLLLGAGDTWKGQIRIDLTRL